MVFYIAENGAGEASEVSSTGK